MNSKERHELRYQKRKLRRLQKRQEIIDSIGSAEEVLNYKDMYNYGKDCCKNVRWKLSVQNFERHLFSRTAVNRHRALDDSYKIKALSRFLLNERGKVRQIEAPYIDDRQIQKTITQEVLLKLYKPQLIYDNGASTKDKGLLFSQNQLDKALRKHIKKYGYNGWIIVADFTKFFPNADREIVKKKHQVLKDYKLIRILDTITDSGSSYKGLSIGVEPSQVEMIAYPSPIDNYMSCQLGLAGFGHYMDDYHIIVPPHKNPKEVLKVFVDMCSNYGIIVSIHKTQIVPIGKDFKYCKIKRIFKNNKIIKRGCRDSAVRIRRKIKMFNKYKSKYSIDDIYASIQSSLAYLKQYNNHSTELRLRRLFYSLFGCTLENYRRSINEICMS